MIQSHSPSWRRFGLAVVIFAQGCASRRTDVPVQSGGAGANLGGAGAGAVAGGGSASGGAGYDVTLGTGAACGESVTPPEEEAGTIPSSFRWCSTGPLVSPIPNDDHPILSVKDPTIVYHGGRWHVFATTADSNAQWSMVYLSFADFKDAPNARIYYLNDNPALAGYHAAPQVFYFAPQKKWYLIFQSGQPQYTTTDDISEPESWLRPTNFFAGVPAILNKSAGGWLDFWVISAKEVLAWVNTELGSGYAWPGNVRELEQCVRNVLVRKRYRPARRAPSVSGLDQALLASQLGAEALLDRYVALVYRETQSYVETGRRLGLDRRTVKDRCDRYSQTQ